MLPTASEQVAAHFASIRARFGDRLVGIAFAILAESLLILVVLSMGLVERQAKRDDIALVSMSIRPPAKPAAKPPAARPKPIRKALQQPSPQPSPSATPKKPADIPPSQPIILLSRSEMASLDIARLPRQPARAPGKSAMGPPDNGVAGDSKRVGTAPGGEPMYAASWYREPHDDELRGYLSTAQAPGWALITCRTVPNFRVEDCVGLSEYPERSQILRAVLAAAWQFQVRPPRIGGISKVGTWVRIRIEYSDR